VSLNNDGQRNHEFTLMTIYRGRSSSLEGEARQCIGEMMIGLCFMEKGDVAGAIASFRRGLQATQRTEHEELGLYYEMGTAYEYAGDSSEALYYLQKVEKRDPTFRNVRSHLQRLLARSVPPPPSLTPALEDLDRAFDELVKE
jgi:tetratricopeptide (TPR) repeat protein